MKKKKYIIAGAAFVFFMFILVSIPLLSNAAYNYGNSGVLMLPPKSLPGLTIGPAEQYVQGSTNTLQAWVKNDSGSTRTIYATKGICRCREATGYPYRTGVGQCQYYWNPDSSNTMSGCQATNEEITLPPYGSYLMSASVTQYNNQACGSFQIDFYFNRKLWVGSFANMGQDCPNPTITCYSNSDCGSNGYVDSVYCSESNVYQNYKTYTCNNPGTTSSYCSDSTSSQLKQDCTANQMCSNGSCVDNPTLTASCSASPNPTNTNQTVTFMPSVSGGTGSYSYSWSGACSGYGPTCSNSYSSSGTQTAFLQVTSGSQVVSTSCAVSVSQTQSNLLVSCFASPSSINANQSTTFISSVSGGTGSYSYSWTGACSGSSSNCSQNFGSQGNYTANVAVTSGSQAVSASCSVSVNQQNITCYSNSDCGSNSYTGSNYCSGSSIYRSYVTYTCNNAGTANSYCSNSTTSQLVQACSTGQSCSGGVCTSANTQTYSASISKTAKNLSASYGDFASYVSANPNSLLQFKIVVQAPSNQTLTSVVVTDILPNNLIYAGSLMVDGVSYGSTSIASGVNLGTILAGQSKTITYYVQVASGEHFAFGTTTLNNVASVTQQGLSLGSASASVAVTKTGTLGVTNVPTGIFGGNQWQGYAALLLLIVGALAWILKASKVKVPTWVGSGS